MYIIFRFTIQIPKLFLVKFLRLKTSVKNPLFGPHKIIFLDICHNNRYLILYLNNLNRGNYEPEYFQKFLGKREGDREIA